MNDWPIEGALDDRLRRVVNEEVAAADSRQIVLKHRTGMNVSRMGTGLAFLGALALIVALVWRSQGNAPFGGPSESPSSLPTATATAPATPGTSSSPVTPASPRVTASVTAGTRPTTAPVAAGTAGPTADPALQLGHEAWLLQDPGRGRDTIRRAGVDRWRLPAGRADQPVDVWVRRDIRPQDARIHAHREHDRSAGTSSRPRCSVTGVSSSPAATTPPQDQQTRRRPTRYSIPRPAASLP